MSVKKYCYCDNNCKYETLDKEEILTAISQAVATGSIGNCDTGFITTIKTITGKPLKFFVGTQEEYEVLTAAQKQNLFALITNDTTKEGLLRSIEELKTSHSELRQGLISGSFKVKNATNADRATTDQYGAEFNTNYFRTSNYIYSGNAVNGVIIYGKKRNGHAYIVNWYALALGTYCFGLIHWSGSTTYSTEIRIGDGFVVKIEKIGEEGEYFIGKATIVRNDYGFSATINISDTELEFISLTDSIPAE